MKIVLRSLYSSEWLWYIKSKKASYIIYVFNYLDSEKGQQKHVSQRRSGKKEGNYGMNLKGHFKFNLTIPETQLIQ